MNIQEQLDNADQLIEQGNFIDAISSYNAIVKSEPNCDEAWLMLGSLYGEMGEIEKSIEHLQKAIAVNPNDSYAHLALGQVQNAAGNFDESKINFTKAVECDSESIEALCALASFYQQQQDFPAAIMTYDQAVAIDDTLVNVWEILGALHFHNNDLEAAEKSYQKAISLRPETPDAFLGFCSLLTHTSRSQDTLQLIDKLPEAAKANEDVLFQRALAYSKEGLHSEALRDIDDAIKINPLEKYILGKIELLQVKSDYEEAFDLLKPFVEKDEPNIKAVITLAKFCKQIELVDECIQLLDRVTNTQQLTPYETHEVKRVKELLESY